MSKISERQNTDIHTEGVLKHVELQRRYFQINAKTFATQIATASVANILGSIAGHPLDTIRVRMQVEAGNPTVLGILGSTIRGEGFRGFFKGLLAPCVAQTPYNTIIFTINENVKEYLTVNHPEMDIMQKSFIGGSIAGLVANIVYCPFELLKCRAQVNRQENVRYRTIVPQLIRNEGMMALYKGFLPLVCRDVPAWAVYFWSYEFLKEKFGITEADQNGKGNSTYLSIMTRMWCAGVAGQLSWGCSYPFDIIKTEIQCTVDRKISIREVMVKGYRDAGVTYFFKGLSPTLLRAFVVSAVALPAFEYLNSRYNKPQE